MKMFIKSGLQILTLLDGTIQDFHSNRYWGGGKKETPPR